MRRIAGSVPLLMLAGCATLFGGGSNQTVSIQSTPSSATFVVKAGSGMQFASGTTPMSVPLPRRHEYQIDITAAGFQPQHVTLTKWINGWVFANFLNGLIGFAIDFLSGAAYKLEPALITVALQPGTGESDRGITYSRIRLFSKDGKLVREHIEALVPADAAK